MNPQYAVIGTYNLEGQEGGTAILTNDGKTFEEEHAPPQRNGSLILIKVDGDEVYVITCWLCVVKSIFISSRSLLV